MMETQYPRLQMPLLPHMTCYDHHVDMVEWHIHLQHQLFNCVLQRLCGTELRGARSCDMNRLTSTRIAALARRTCLRRKNTETSDGHLVSRLEAGNDSVDDCLDGAL